MLGSPLSPARVFPNGNGLEILCSPPQYPHVQMCLLSRQNGSMLRHDVRLTSACNLCLIHDDDGEYVLRVLRRGEPNVFLTPKIRLERKELEQLIQLVPTRFESGSLLVRIDRDTVTVLVNGELAGWGGRLQLEYGLGTFFRTVDVLSGAAPIIGSTMPPV